MNLTTNGTLQNSLQAAAKGTTTNVPKKAVYKYMFSHPEHPLDCQKLATHFNVIGNAKDKIAKDMSAIYLANKDWFVRDALRLPYTYTYKGDKLNPLHQKTTATVATTKQRDGAEKNLAKRAMAYLAKYQKRYFSPGEISAATGVGVGKLAQALGGAYRTPTGAANGLLRAPHGKTFKYAIRLEPPSSADPSGARMGSPRSENAGQAGSGSTGTITVTDSLRVAAPEAINISGLSSLIAEVVTLDERTRGLALKVGTLMAALPVSVREDFVAWSATLGGGK